MILDLEQDPNKAALNKLILLDWSGTIYCYIVS